MAFGNFGKKIGEFAHNTSEKVSDMAETSKLNGAIGDRKAEIQKTYVEIGKRYFEEFGGNPEIGEAYRADCETIRKSLERIRWLELKVLEVNGKTVCTGCGEEIDATLAFCSKCGTKVALPDLASMPGADPAEAPKA